MGENTHQNCTRQNKNKEDPGRQQPCWGLLFCTNLTQPTGSVTGVNDVVSFDENEIVLDTDMGLLTVRGKELHVKRLTLEKGELDLEGQVDSLNYSSNAALKRSGDSFLNRLFK